MFILVYSRLFSDSSPFLKRSIKISGASNSHVGERDGPVIERNSKGNVNISNSLFLPHASSTSKSLTERNTQNNESSKSPTKSQGDETLLCGTTKFCKADVGGNNVVDARSPQSSPVRRRRGVVLCSRLLDKCITCW